MTHTCPGTKKKTPLFLPYIESSWDDVNLTCGVSESTDGKRTPHNITRNRRETWRSDEPARDDYEARQEFDVRGYWISR